MLFADNVYEPTRNIARGMLRQYGISARSFDPLDPPALRAMIKESTRVVMLESPGSLTMEVSDIPALTAIAREHGAVSVIDNTWATGLGFPALKHGCDISVISLTKHVGGHSDLMMGCASAPAPLIGQIRKQAQSLGQVVSPDDAALALRGLRTMALRLERSTASALKIAQWLAARPQVATVLCPMLPGAPGHDLWKRDFSGGCGLFSFTLATPDAAARARMVDALTLFGLGYSWGGYESLAIPFDPAPIRDFGAIPPGAGLRLAIGLEDPDDLIADLEGAFSAI